MYGAEIENRAIPPSDIKVFFFVISQENATMPAISAPLVSSDKFVILN